jgi:hypothetical protein
VQQPALPLGQPRVRVPWLTHRTLLFLHLFLVSRKILHNRVNPTLAARIQVGMRDFSYGSGDPVELEERRMRAIGRLQQGET